MRCKCYQKCIRKNAFLMLCITHTTYSKPQACVHVDLYIKQSILHTSAHNLKAHFSEMLKIIQKQEEFKFIFWLLLSYLLNYMVIYKKKFL